MFEIVTALVVGKVFNIVMLAGAVVGVVICFVLLMRRIRQRLRERD